ncbi:AIR synthase family protein [Caldisalinibacter kiritimatiensis]|uniref:Thiamine-monophosphate kinase n=1 Tax=Caldisalinibacter kiritimatiensis TaxID=1304284 RepID=R1ATN7_9FIRM|nr:AIR synthase family protein [Caldisalinibacter kiritimatiensis]EOD00473.1 Thiamine-monophosphate kinase [Caldisalinibacter kiritimatiensis]
MEIGKLPNELLEKLVISRIKNKREDVITRAGVGEDCAVIDYGKYSCVLSTDPITGATHNIGRLAVNISCNDVASNGAEPVAILMTIMAPPSIKEDDIKVIMDDAGQASKELNVEIVGGHTEITDAVNRTIITTTAIGKQLKVKTLKPEEVKVGDKILLTKMAGIEGTSIIASELEETLSTEISQELLKQAKGFINDISVVKEGMICGEIGVKYMHDITEGGVLGAVWEASKAIKKGVLINKTDIPIAESTKKICDFYNIDPLRLISSGSMLIVCGNEKVDIIKQELRKNSIVITVIGEVTESGVFMKDGDEIEEIAPPESDELYKVI